MADVIMSHALNDHKIRVLRLEPQVFKNKKINGFLDTFQLPITIPDIIEQIGKKYGGGKYQIRIIDNAGLYVKAKAFEIAGLPKLFGEEISEVDGPVKDARVKQLETQLAHKNELLKIKDQLLLNKERELMKSKTKNSETDKEFLENSHDDIKLDTFDSCGQLKAENEKASIPLEWTNFAMQLHAQEIKSSNDTEVEVVRSQERVSMYRYELYATLARWITVAAAASTMTYFIV